MNSQVVRWGVIIGAGFLTGLILLGQSREIIIRVGQRKEV